MSRLKRSKLTTDRSYLSRFVLSFSLSVNLNLTHPSILYTQRHIIMSTVSVLYLLSCRLGSSERKGEMPGLELTSFAPSSSSFSPSLSQRRLRSSSLRLHLPWEILHEMCRQSDSPTLYNLCLVSFGMLQLAGPELCRDVEIASLDGLYSFFIPVGILSHT